ncbi:MAG: hypothetical protein LH606_13610, partial [Cytophagaceae bacterium]|nr:hypothetical protein [Cytophagaceae bacterium]
ASPETPDFIINGKPHPIGLTSRSNAARDPQQHYGIPKTQLISPEDELIDLREEQVTTAQAETETDWVMRGQTDKKPAYPSTFRIKRNRPATQGLLLIYPLNPKVAVLQNRADRLAGKLKPESRQISTVPVVGIAVSFPQIANDAKVKYFANEQFKTEYEYPEILDQDDDDPTP